ncbi:MAG TPA: MBL fold metallo-hydrolase [Solirubrobacteraceae bacterium]|jgi:glyoxylase-like metal-dependent hydrolase (beta-lactamase superfamily II)
MSTTPTPVADGIWRVTLGRPLKINVFLIREGDGVAVFDSASRQLGPAIREAAEALGGATRVIVGNAHPDHRGGAPAIGAPVHCHADERADVEGDGGAHYFDYEKLPFYARPLTRRIMRSWDGGPLHVAQTLAEGDRVGEDFEVVHLPGHGPGCIGLWRASDRLALSNDCFALFDPAFPRPGRPRIPHPTFNWSTERVPASIEKLAALGPRTCWPGHFGPLTGDVAAQLRAIR